MDVPPLWLVLVVVPLLVLVAVSLFHVFARRPDLSVFGKGGWAATIVLLPYAGVLVYALTRPPRTAYGKATHADEEPGTTMRRLRRLIDDHDSGRIDDEFAAEKAELFGL
jgi:hypothetical protein